MKTPIPDEVTRQLQLLGDNLRQARVRRGETQDAFAQRVGLTRPTIAAMEKGGSGVSIASYAMVLWVIGMQEDISSIADPDRDMQGKALERAREPERIRSKSVQDSQRFDF